MGEIRGWVSICGGVMGCHSHGRASRGGQTLDGMEVKATGCRLGTLVNNGR